MLQPLDLSRARTENEGERERKEVKKKRRRKKIKSWPDSIQCQPAAHTGIARHSRAQKNMISKGDFKTCSSFGQLLRPFSLLLGGKKEGSKINIKYLASLEENEKNFSPKNKKAVMSRNEE